MSQVQVDHRQLQIDDPLCPICSRPMDIIRIEPDELGHQRRTYKCPECQLVESLMLKHR
jgi:transposase-like protein